MYTFEEEINEQKPFFKSIPKGKMVLSGVDIIEHNEKTYVISTHIFYRELGHKFRVLVVTDKKLKKEILRYGSPSRYTLGFLKEL